MKAHLESLAAAAPSGEAAAEAPAEAPVGDGLVPPAAVETPAE